MDGGVQVQDCVMSAWSAWSPCVITGCATDPAHVHDGLQIRSRTVTTHAANGGAACGATIATQPCQVGVHVTLSVYASACVPY